MKVEAQKVQSSKSMKCGKCKALEALEFAYIYEQELDSHVFKETSAQWLDYNIYKKKVPKPSQGG